MLGLMAIARPASTKHRSATTPHRPPRPLPTVRRGQLPPPPAGISFLTDEVAALRDENAQLRREYRQSSQLQASAIQSLRTELRAVRETRCQMGPAGGRQLPFSYAAVTSPHHPLSSARGGGGTPLLAGEASSSAPVDGLSATLNESRTDLAEPVQPSGHPRRQAPSNVPRGGAQVQHGKASVVEGKCGNQLYTCGTATPSSTSPTRCVCLQAHIQRRGPVRELVCTRLKTRHEGYSSFHVTAADDEMEKLFDPLLWPEGSLFKEFTGQLTDSRTYQA
ncbi:hypothetical protein HPB47_024370, partial [Ixodes persulcatus]